MVEYSGRIQCFIKPKTMDGCPTFSEVGESNDPSDWTSPRLKPWGTQPIN